MSDSLNFQSGRVLLCGAQCRLASLLCRARSHLDSWQYFCLCSLCAGGDNDRQSTDQCFVASVPVEEKHILFAHNIMHDGIYIANLGYDGEGPSLQLCTSNITSWGSGYKAIIEGYLSNKIVAIQEHKLLTPTLLIKRGAKPETTDSDLNFRLA